MATQKNFYYVLVFTDDGPVYVTGTGVHHTAFWDKDEKPMYYSKEFANDMVVGLNWNGYSAVMVVSSYEIEHQPYNYAKYELTWKEVNNNDKA